MSMLISNGLQAKEISNARKIIDSTSFDAMTVNKQELCHDTPANVATDDPSQVIQQIVHVKVNDGQEHTVTVCVGLPYEAEIPQQSEQVDASQPTTHRSDVFGQRIPGYPYVRLIHPVSPHGSENEDGEGKHTGQEAPYVVDANVKSNVEVP